MRCLARFDAALAVFNVCGTFPLGQSISVPGEQPRQARSPQWRVALAIELECCPGDGDAVFMLPGWRNSRGACIEHQLAVGLGLEVIDGVSA